MKALAEPDYYSVSARKKRPLVEFIADALSSSGCHLLHVPKPDRAPFRFTFETPEGERSGIMAYAFFSNSKETRNRPSDEHRFQIKYGKKDGRWHTLWQDPFSLYTTLFLGIDPERGLFIGADPNLHNPTRFFISLEYKQAQVERILNCGWHAWEREKRDAEQPVEVLVGGSQGNFLRFVRFEQEAFGESQGERALLAEQAADSPATIPGTAAGPLLEARRLHDLAKEFEMSEDEVLDLISNARRLKMAVRGWVAEEHLVRTLSKVDHVTDCVRNDAEGQADVHLKFDGVPLTVECKNSLRQTAADGTPRIDFQRTRAAKNNPCSRYYAPEDFNVVAACLHAVENRWNFRFIPTAELASHRLCPGKLSSNVRVDSRWKTDAVEALSVAARLAA